MNVTMYAGELDKYISTVDITLVLNSHDIVMGNP